MDETEAIAKNVRLCTTRSRWHQYYAKAEAAMDRQWDTWIWPLIKESDFTCTVDLATGAGRNAAKLLPLASDLHLVDVNDYAIDMCRERFRHAEGPCRIHYHVNDGTTLPGIADETVTFVYCWDAAVHFDKFVILQYLREFSRIMKHGATGFIHHSNYGCVADDTDFQKHPHSRSNMTAALFLEYCHQTELECLAQKLLVWGGIPDLDCISRFRKP
ncbi:MAG: class I SAM-dependent methyltransferase [Planctomycetota bacterium]